LTKKGGLENQAVFWERRPEKKKKKKAQIQRKKKR